MKVLLPIKVYTQMRGKHMKNFTSRHKTLLCSLLISFALLLLVYLGFVIYFSNHFFFNTKINGIDASKMNVEETEQLLADEINNYSITITGRNNLTDSISADEIQLTYVSNSMLTNHLTEQNSFLWFISVFQPTDLELNGCSSYNEDAFEEKLSSLTFFQKEHKEAPKNAKIQYLDEQGYCIVNEQQGSTVLKKELKEKLSAAILHGETEFSLEREGCYKKPTITSESPELLELFDKVTKYSQAEITYKFGKKTEVVDHSVIKKWLKINNKKLTVKFKKEAVRSYVDYIGSTYNTYGKTRTFKASTGNKVSVSGGDYGWLLNREKETTDLIKLVKKGKITTRKPAYTQKAVSYGSKDWGKTYVEINLTAQHLWFYKNGKLVIQSDFVSGNVSKGHSTPQGAYCILYKERDAILGARSNADYRTPVDFWMPFNGGIGMHDATWRSRFGGTIYKNSGSHGCINLPYSVAQTIFNNISTGDPVICYYDPGYYN